MCAVLQSIQELSPEIAKQHGLAIQHWPAPSPAPAACPAQQISHLSLQERPANSDGLPSAGPPQSTQGSPEPQSARETRDDQDRSHSQRHADQEQEQTNNCKDYPPAQSELNASWPPRRIAASPASACNGASSAALPQTQEPGVAQQSSAAEALVLSCKASVPGHSWLRCPTLRLPDAAQSDYITVRCRPWKCAEA